MDLETQEKFYEGINMDLQEYVPKDTCVEESSDHYI